MLEKIKREEMEIWVTDDGKEAVRLKDEDKCVVFVLTEHNRHIFVPEISYCVEECCLRDISEDYLRKVWQRHMGLPWHILDTERLTLREMSEDDLDALYEIQGEEDSTGFMDRLEPDRQIQLLKIRDYIRCMYGFYEFGIWMIVRKETGQVIGRAGLQVREDCEEPELGFAIAPAFRGCGFAFEACQAVLQYGFEELQLPAVRAVVHRENTKSLRLCEKLGFVQEGNGTAPESPGCEVRCRKAILFYSIHRKGVF